MAGRPRYRRSQETRAILLQAVVDLVEREHDTVLHVDRIAARAGVHKMAIYRNFGSRAGLMEAVAGWLCERERARWAEIEHRSGGVSRDVLMNLFADLARRMADDAACGCRLIRLASRADDDTQPAGAWARALREALRAFLEAHCRASGAAEPAQLADTLMLIWYGAAGLYAAGDAAEPLTTSLPAIVGRVLGSHLPAAGAAPASRARA